MAIILEIRLTPMLAFLAFISYFALFALPHLTTWQISEQQLSYTLRLLALKNAGHVSCGLKRHSPSYGYNLSNGMNSGQKCTHHQKLAWSLVCLVTTDFKWQMNVVVMIFTSHNILCWWSLDEITWSSCWLKRWLEPGPVSVGRSLIFIFLHQCIGFFDC